MPIVTTAQNPSAAVVADEIPGNNASSPVKRRRSIKSQELISSSLNSSLSVVNKKSVSSESSSSSSSSSPIHRLQRSLCDGILSLPSYLTFRVFEAAFSDLHFCPSFIHSKDTPFEHVQTAAQLEFCQDLFLLILWTKREEAISDVNDVINELYNVFSQQNDEHSATQHLIHNRATQLGLHSLVQTRHSVPRNQPVSFRPLHAFLHWSQIRAWRQRLRELLEDDPIDTTARNILPITAMPNVLKHSLGIICAKLSVLASQSSTYKRDALVCLKGAARTNGTQLSRRLFHLDWTLPQSLIISKESEEADKKSAASFFRHCYKFAMASPSIEIMVGGNKDPFSLLQQFLDATHHQWLTSVIQTMTMPLNHLWDDLSVTLRAVYPNSLTQLNIPLCKGADISNQNSMVDIENDATVTFGRNPFLLDEDSYTDDQSNVIKLLRKISEQVRTSGSQSNIEESAFWGLLGGQFDSAALMAESWEELFLITLISIAREIALITSSSGNDADDDKFRAAGSHLPQTDPIDIPFSLGAFSQATRNNISAHMKQFRHSCRMSTDDSSDESPEVSTCVRRVLSSILANLHEVTPEASTEIDLVESLLPTLESDYTTAYEKFVHEVVNCIKQHHQSRQHNSGPVELYHLSLLETAITWIQAEDDALIAFQQEETTGSKTAGSKTTGSKAADSKAAGSKAAGSETSTFYCSEKTRSEVLNLYVESVCRFKTENFYAYNTQKLSAFMFQPFDEERYSDEDGFKGVPMQFMFSCLNMLEGAAKINALNVVLLCELDLSALSIVFSSQDAHFATERSKVTKFLDTKCTQLKSLINTLSVDNATELFQCLHRTVSICISQLLNTLQEASGQTFSFKSVHSELKKTNSISGTTEVQGNVFLDHLHDRILFHHVKSICCVAVLSYVADIASRHAVDFDDGRLCSWIDSTDSQKLLALLRDYNPAISSWNIQYQTTAKILEDLLALSNRLLLVCQFVENCYFSKLRLDPVDLIDEELAGNEEQSPFSTPTAASMPMWGASARCTQNSNEQITRRSVRFFIPDDNDEWTGDHNGTEFNTNQSRATTTTTAAAAADASVRTPYACGRIREGAGGNRYRVDSVESDHFEESSRMINSNLKVFWQLPSVRSDFDSKENAKNSNSSRGVITLTRSSRAVSLSPKLSCFDCSSAYTFPRLVIRLLACCLNQIAEETGPPQNNEVENPDKTGQPVTVYSVSSSGQTTKLVLEKETFLNIDLSTLSLHRYRISNIIDANSDTARTKNDTVLHSWLKKRQKANMILSIYPTNQICLIPLATLKEFDSLHFPTYLLNSVTNCGAILCRQPDLDSHNNSEDTDGTVQQQELLFENAEKRFNSEQIGNYTKCWLESVDTILNLVSSSDIGINKYGIIKLPLFNNSWRSNEFWTETIRGCLKQWTSVTELECNKLFERCYGILSVSDQVGSFRLNWCERLAEAVAGIFKDRRHGSAGQ